MTYLYSILIVVLSTVLWRVRGGLGERQGIEIPCNKIWYAVFFGIFSYFAVDGLFSVALIGFIAAYTSYQLFGWGKYQGAATGGGLNPYEPENELIDGLLDNLKIKWRGVEYKLINYPRLYGVFGMSLTGAIITFIWGLFFRDLWFMPVGLGMGLCSYLGYLTNKIISDGKDGWNWAEWYTGFYFGLCLLGV